MTKPRKEAFAVMNQGMMGFVTANNDIILPPAKEVAGKVMFFSHVHLSFFSQDWGSYVTITHNALELTIMGPPLSPPDVGPPLFMEPLTLPIL